jgi:hypothetical protein
MEPLLAGKSRQLILSAVKALHPVLLKTWGNPQGFRQAASTVLNQVLGSEKTNPNEVAALAEQIYQLVSQIRSLHIRHIQTSQALNQAHKSLEPTFAAAPIRQATLVLAVQLHQTALNYFASPEGDKAYQALIAALDTQRMALAHKLQENEQIVMDQVESALASIAATVTGKQDMPFHDTALAGRLIERARQLARLHPSQAAVPADFSNNSPEIRVVSALEDAVRRAELNEARARFGALNEYQKGARYEALRKLMIKHIDRIAPHAPDGFDQFCQAVEAIAFPYPTPLEWVRVFLKPLFTNAQQSSTFDKCRTEQSVQHRYLKIRDEKGANPIMLELARAFALANLRIAQAESIHAFLNEVDLAREFHWPASLAELKERLGRKSGASA